MKDDSQRGVNWAPSTTSMSRALVKDRGSSLKSQVWGCYTTPSGSEATTIVYPVGNSGLAKVLAVDP